MELSQKQNLTQGLRQEQIMTHQQIQALELLFLPVLELQSVINEELAKNPILDTEISAEEEKAANLSTENDDWLEKILKMDEENRFIRGKSTAKYSEEDEEKRQFYLESITAEQTFQESLLEQLKFMGLDQRLLLCCEVVISGLNDDGYLVSHPADLAMAAGENMNLINQAISIVRQLEPPGVAAKDLRERLMLQLERKGLENTPVYEAVSEHLDDIAANRLPQVAKRMGITIEKLKDIVAEIQNLNPRINTDSVSPHEYIQEEVEVYEEEGELKIKVKNEHLPSLHISKHYRELLEDATTPRETRDYIKDKLKAGTFLINSIIQRQSTIKRIVTALVEHQAEFFLTGMNCLKPLTMAKIAEKLGIHETTVSRAVAGKYMRCKYGLLPIRHFFSTGYETEDGESVSKNVIKDAIRALIDKEDVYSPLSDSDIVEKLKSEGYNVARRTVAKYRESMNILPSHLRRQY